MPGHMVGQTTREQMQTVLRIGKGWFSHFSQSLVHDSKDGLGEMLTKAAMRAKGQPKLQIIIRSTRFELVWPLINAGVLSRTLEQQSYAVALLHVDTTNLRVFCRRSEHPRHGRMKPERF